MDESPRRASALLAALDSEAAPAHLASLCEELTAPGGALLLDELSFEIFGPVLASHSHPSCCETAERVLLALAGAANAREIFCLVMEGFRIHEAPRSQLWMLRLLAALLHVSSGRRRVLQLGAQLAERALPRDLAGLRVARHGGR